MKKNTLIITGSGIKFLAHLTHETKVHVKHADKVLYLANEPATEEWIKRHNKNTESLYSLYIKHNRRIDCYKEITQKILLDLKQYNLLCVIFYGHPTVFAMPALDAAIQASKLGYHVISMPAISAEDCLFSDLLIDPGFGGCQSYETTEFLIKDKIIDVNAHLILWQVGTIGAIGRPSNFDNSKGINALMKKLSRYYDLTHPAIIYEAAQYSHFKPRIDKINIHGLPDINLTSLSTLYIPPAKKSKINMEILNELELTLKDLEAE